MESLRTFDSFYDLIEYFSDEQICRDHLEKVRWNGQPTCVQCGHDKVYTYNVKGRGKRFKCAKCEKIFTVTTGTIFHSTNLSLRKWFFAIYLITAHKKGISSHQLARDLKITQKTAWYVLHRVRQAYTPEKETFEGTIEIDETFVGGKNKNRHKSKRLTKVTGRSVQQKTPVLGIIQRGGKVYALPVADTTKKTLLPVMRERIADGSKVYTDEWKSYQTLNRHYEHEVIRHNADEYVRGNVHTNSIESFWALFKRGIIGIYHHVSPKHLDRYVNEFSYRYNNRDLSEGSKFDVLLANTQKRLTYQRLIDGKA